MSRNSSIEWCDDTWNPVTGCTEVSPGCDHCYAKTFAERWRGTPGHYFENGFDVQLRPDKLDQPLRWRKPRRIFVNSMSDLFHQAVPDDYIARVFAVMAQAPQHTFQLLTKRHARMRHLLSNTGFQAKVYHHSGSMTWPLPNVWVGVSAENQQWADTRIPVLLDTPAAVRFVSAEPLLGPIDLHTDPIEAGSPFWGSQLDWVIVGGESGPGARPMHPDWARSLRDQCAAAGVAFLFKQWGEWVPERMLLHADNAPAVFLASDGRVRPLVNGKPTAAPMSRGDDITIRRVGKKAAGRELDGRTHDDYPQAVR
ncbi:phage Gp37/Gp68 family protein [Mycolicibacterium pulveris]|uniref:Phage Gp37/Gp68 family protein n=1 Tax=Mycolicibacterium pulveris TaxID=36813 RepID=A0A7I7UBV0_MYCPV|nr:phage Gp37/Gp68 family protein [Mycolicibacterium pulveris]MCV6982128.1 phage Gp37/Gp68 family protein [Mycolicibacterium pulveris]BBY78918.1 hypothetical protein MPUL_00760 [Mycolicibacterium pulveris]